MVLKFGTWNKNDQQSIMVLKTRLSNGYYRVYNVYFDEKIIGTTLGAWDKIIVIDENKLGSSLTDDLNMFDLVKMGYLAG